MEGEKFIKIDEVIERAKNLGVDFGKGNPKNRLRYYAKSGLLPPAKRKIFEGRLPTGAYPESVINTLVNIDQGLRQGKTIHKIVEEKKQNIFPKSEIIFQSEKNKDSKTIIFPFKDEPEEQEEFYEARADKPLSLNPFSKLRTPFLISVLIAPAIIGGAIVLFLGISKDNAYFASLLENIRRIVQLDDGFQSRPSAEREDGILPRQEFLINIPEPYLTINVETDINAPLNLKSKDSASFLNFFQDNFKGSVILGALTENRSYTLPNETGIICLSTGNCIGLAGEVTTSGGTLNRIAKFVGPQRVGDSSISDFYAGVSMYITSGGNIGIGTSAPESALDVRGDISAGNLIAGNLITARTFYAKEKLGIGKEASDYALEVDGRIQATGDICTDIGGGKCLSQLTSQLPMFFGGPSGISGSGSSGYLSKWTSSSAIGNSILYEQSSLIGIGTTSPNEKLTISGAVSLAEIATPSATSGYGKLYVATDGKLYYIDSSGIVYNLTSTGTSGTGSAGQVAFFTATSTLSGNNEFFWDATSTYLGIGTTTPSYKLEVVGTTKTTNLITHGFQLLTGSPTSGKALISDNFGVGTWQALPAGTLPFGSDGQTMRYSAGAANWIASSFLYNSGTAIGIGTTTPSSVLTLIGDMSLTGPITLTTTTLPQLVLRYDANNYFKTSINSTSTTLTASKALIIDSLTGEIRTGSNTTLFNASLATIQGATFVSASTDSTVRKSGEYVFRGAASVFRYSMPAQLATTTYTRVSKYFENILDTFPSALPGSAREYAFIINSADDIATTSNAEWRIYRPRVLIEHATFTLSGQNFSSLEEGIPQMSNFVTLPSTDWQLEVRAPAGKTIRIFNIMLLAYDKIN